MRKISGEIISALQKHLATFIAMYKITITITLLLASLSSFSQNWTPFALGESHHYRFDTGTWIDRTIRIDSVTNDAQGTVWHFPRLLTVLDASHAVSNVPHFCQRTLRVQGNGKYQFFDPGNVSLDVHSGLGAVALMDSANGSVGTVTRLAVGSVLGLVDSIKVIQLSAGDSLVLSKAHGIVEWPASLGPQRYMLVGLQKQHLGDTLPGFDGFFRFGPGDVYYWGANGSSYDNTRPPSQQDDPWSVGWRIEILSAVRDSSGLQLSTRILLRRPDQADSYENRTIHIPDQPFGLPVVGPGEMITGGPSVASYFFQAVFSSWNAFSVDYHYSDQRPVTTARYIHRNDTTILTVALTNHQQPQYWYLHSSLPASDTMSNFGDLGERFEFREGLGFCSTSARASWGGRQETWRIALSGYVINGVTVGNLGPDEIIPGPGLEEFACWPNPTRTEINFQVYGDEARTISIFDLLGRKLASQVVVGTAKFDVRGLRAGVYLIGFQEPTRRVYRKFHVVH